MSGTPTRTRSTGSPPKPNRADIWLADLDPTGGRELGRKPRPVLIVSTDSMNKGAFECVIVVPATTAVHDIPCHVAYARRMPDGRAVTAYSCCEDVRSISVLRLQRQLSVTPTPTRIMASVENWLRDLMGL